MMRRAVASLLHTTPSAALTFQNTPTARCPTNGARSATPCFTPGRSPSRGEKRGTTDRAAAAEMWFAGIDLRSSDEASAVMPAAEEARMAAAHETGSRSDDRAA